jgi:Ran GTPase-activating protein (RanGAP) involved in mRNA processing and transport
MLERAPSLEELELSNCSIGDDGALHLARGLSSENCHLKTLKIINNGIGDNGARHLACALVSENCRLESLDVSDNSIGDDGARAIGAALSQNPVLVKLFLHENYIGHDGAVAIADALTSNRSLRHLEITLNPIGEQAASILGEALRANHTLRSLDLSKSINALIGSIPHMSGLLSLSVSYVEEVDSEQASTFLKAIECNTTLESLDLGVRGESNKHLTEIMPQVRRLTALNRAGRRILKSETEVARSLWPHILGRSSGNNPEAIYFFLRENPHLFKKKQSVLGKRKRGHFSCVIS